MWTEALARLAACLLGTCVLAGCARGTATMPSAVPATGLPGPHRPSIVLIMADDLGFECIGANDGASYATPVLDRLAAGGIRFEHAYAQPLCTPSRVQIMTGLYNSRNYSTFGVLPEGSVTFAHVLRRAGYVTGIFGKWQLGGGLAAPERFGFDEHVLWHLHRRGPRYVDPLLSFNGRAVQLDGGRYGPDEVSDQAVRFIERHRDRPFFLYYPMILPHEPFVPPPGNPGWEKAVTSNKEPDDPAAFSAMVAHLDSIVGKLVASLDRLGLRERTLVLFTGDNGTDRAIHSLWRGHEVRGGKGLMLDSGTRVPLIASWPGRIPAGIVDREPVDFTDFFPTLAELAGVSPAVLPPTDGHSLKGRLLGEEAPAREWVYSWFDRNGRPGDEVDEGEFARTVRYKLYGDGRFYDVPADPMEHRPLQMEELDPATRSTRQRLADVITRYTRRSVAPAGAGAPGDASGDRALP